jgi:two-component system, NarL family, response regulator DegU
LTTILTARQLEVVKLVAKCLTNKEVAKELHLSEQTVKNHMASINHRLHTQGRMGIIITAIKEGWITIDDLEIPKVSEGLRWY